MLAAAELGSTGSQAVEATATTSQAVKTRPRLIASHHDLRLSPLILEWALFLLEPAPLRFSRRKPFPHTCAIR